MRDHVLAELTRLAKENLNIYLITGDLGYVVLDDFRENCPNQFINAGIAEQNMTALAAGMAREGNVGFTYSIGNFPTLRCIEQIRNDVCYHKENVKIMAVGGGFVYGNQGISHHATEDIAMMRVLPNMRVYVPGDAYEAVECLKDAYQYDGPCYIRLARNKEENFHKQNEKVNIEKVLDFGGDGRDVTILTTGSILCEGVKLQKFLGDQNIKAKLVSVPRVKPIDKESIVAIAKNSKLMVTMEEHQICGGLGGTIAEILSEIEGKKAMLYRSGLNDMFSEITGDQVYLREYYGISADKLVPIINNILKEKEDETHNSRG